MEVQQGDEVFTYVLGSMLEAAAHDTVRTNSTFLFSFPSFFLLFIHLSSFDSAFELHPPLPVFLRVSLWTLADI